jgi:hypothetical protein
VAGTFSERTRQLERKVGTGRLVGSVVVDQVYAKYQHETLDLRHDAGRTAKYLERPLLTHHEQYLQRLARNVLDGDLVQAMADNMEHLSGQVEKLAPIDQNDLPRSGHPTVHDGHTVAYDRPPHVARLTPEQLKAKGKRQVDLT